MCLTTFLGWYLTLKIGHAWYLNKNNKWLGVWVNMHQNRCCYYWRSMCAFIYYCKQFSAFFAIEISFPMWEHFFVCYNISILCLYFGSSNNLTGWCLKIKCLKHKVLFGITASCYWRIAVSNVVSDICLFGGEGYSFKLPIYLSWFFFCTALSMQHIFMLEFWLWTDFYVIAIFPWMKQSFRLL